MTKYSGDIDFTIWHLQTERSLGNPYLDKAGAMPGPVLRTQADQFARNVVPVIREIKKTVLILFAVLPGH